VGTKSELEVKAYVLLLQAGVRELEAPGTRVDKFDLADVPAAAETGEETWRTEETLAEALEKRARDAEEVAEAKTWGDDGWLIDEQRADDIEAAHETQGTTAPETKDLDDEGGESDSLYEDDAAADGREAHTHHPTGRPLSSDDLLKPATLLQLSRSPSPPGLATSLSI